MTQITTENFVRLRAFGIQPEDSSTVNRHGPKIDDGSQIGILQYLHLEMFAFLHSSRALHRLIFNSQMV